MAKLVKLHNDTYEKLSTLRKEGETFDETITRLLNLYYLMEKVRGEARGETESVTK